MFGIWSTESKVATVFLARRPQEKHIDASLRVSAQNRQHTL